MQTISLEHLIEEAVASSHYYESLSGAVTSVEALFEPENLAHLDREHQGVFAFLAFHPNADTPFADYVRASTLGPDSGPMILVLYTVDTYAHIAGAPLHAAGVDIDTSVHPAYEAVRLLFAPKSPPALPGIIFVAALSSRGDAVYVELDDLADAEAIRTKLRELFAIANQSLDRASDRSAFPNRFATTLLANRIAYHRAGRTSAREWLLRCYQLAKDCGNDVVAALGALSGGPSA